MWGDLSTQREMVSPAPTPGVCLTKARRCSRTAGRVAAARAACGYCAHHLEAEDVFLCSNQRSRGHALRRTRPYSDGFNCSPPLPPPYSRGALKTLHKYRLPALMSAYSARRLVYLAKFNVVPLLALNFFFRFAFAAYKSNFPCLCFT